MLNVKVGLFGPFDMLKFKNMAKVREKAIQGTEAKEIVGTYTINEKAKERHPKCLKLEVAEVIDHAGANSRTIVFRGTDGSKVPYFRAGQYLSLKLQIGDSFITRPYSISSSPKWALENKVAVTVRSNPSGFAADWIIKNLKVGDKVVSSAPEGHFYYEELRDAKNVVALAGGSGITPFLSMAYAIRDGIEDFNLTVIFGSRTEDSILFKKELDEISAATPKVKVVHVLSDEEKDGFEHGFITADIIRKYAKAPYSIFICGPEAMYRFAEKEIATLNIPGRLVRREMLGVTKNVAGVAGYPAGTETKVFKGTVKQGAAEYTIDVRADESILVALERAGIKAPSRCRSGECGWCRSKLVSGNVFVPAETDGRRYSDTVTGYIHPCSTFALSDIVIEVPGEYL